MCGKFNVVCLQKTDTFVCKMLYVQWAGIMGQKSARLPRRHIKTVFDAVYRPLHKWSTRVMVVPQIVRMCVYIYMYIYIYISVCMNACMHACMYVGMYLCMYVRMHTCVYVYTCT